MTNADQYIHRAMKKVTCHSNGITATPRYLRDCYAWRVDVSKDGKKAYVTFNDIELAAAGSDVDMLVMGRVTDLLKGMGVSQEAVA